MTTGLCKLATSLQLLRDGHCLAQSHPLSKLCSTEYRADGQLDTYARPECGTGGDWENKHLKTKNPELDLQRKCCIVSKFGPHSPLQNRTWQETKNPRVTCPATDKIPPSGHPPRFIHTTVCVNNDCSGHDAPVCTVCLGCGRSSHKL